MSLHHSIMIYLFFLMFTGNFVGIDYLSVAEHLNG